MSIKEFISQNPSLQQIDHYIETEALRIVKEQGKHAAEMVENE